MNLRQLPKVHRRVQREPGLVEQLFFSLRHQPDRSELVRPIHLGQDRGERVVGPRLWAKGSGVHVEQPKEIGGGAAVIVLVPEDDPAAAEGQEGAAAGVLHSEVTAL